MRYPDSMSDAQVQKHTRYSPLTKHKAFEMYLLAEVSLHEIAKTIGIPYTTLWYWIRKEGWIEKRRQYERELAVNFELEYRRQMMSHRSDVLKRTMSLGNQVHDAASHVLDRIKKQGFRTKSQDARDSDVIQTLSRTAKNYGDLTQKAVGLSRGPVTDPAQKTSVLINVGIKPLEQDTVNVIDVSSPADLPPHTPPSQSLSDFPEVLPFEE